MRKGKGERERKRGREGGRVVRHSDAEREGEDKRDQMISDDIDDKNL